MDKISLVVPCFNEQDNIEPFYNAILKVFNDIPASFELMFVDDGSSDNTFERIQALHGKDDRVKCISFSRNFGKEAALFAGIRNTDGDCTVVLDADLQHPPALIKEMYKLERGLPGGGGNQADKGQGKCNPRLLHQALLPDDKPCCPHRYGQLQRLQTPGPEGGRGTGKA